MKEQMINVKNSVQAWCMQHKAFAVVLLVQALVLVYAMTQLFAPKVVIEFPLDSFVQDGASSALTLTGDSLILQNEAEETSEFLLTGDVFSLPRGAYLLTIDYKSVYNIEAPTGSIYDESVTVSLQVSETQSLFAQMEELYLKDVYQQVQGRVMVSYGETVDTAQLLLYYNGTGRTEISAITLEEQLSYRWVCFFALCIAFALIDAALSLVLLPRTSRNAARVRKTKLFFFFFGISVLASLPLFAGYLYNGADLLFHMMRIESVAAELSYGQFPVRIMSDMMNGYGYANSLFYCDIFLYLPAILYNCMLAWRTTYQVYVFLVNFATCAIGYYCFKKISGNTAIAAVGTVMYTLSSYRLANVYTRAGVGEYTALVFFPLVVLGIWGIYRAQKPSYSDWLPLALGVAGIIQSHILSVEIVVVFLVITCLLLLKQTLCFARFKSFVLAVGLCAGLTAWFWVPFLESLMRMDLKYSTAVDAEIQSSGLDILHLFAFGGTGYRLGWGIWIGVLLAGYYLVSHSKWNLNHQWTHRAMQLSLLIGGVAVLFAWDAFPWNAIGYGLDPAIAGFVNVIQFPWRYQAVALACFVLAAVIALMQVKKHQPHYFKAVVCALIAINVAFTGLFYTDFIEDAATLTLDVPDISYTLYVSAGEYLLTGTNANDALYSLPTASSDAVQITDYKKVEGVAYLTCENESDTQQSVTLPIYNYANYQAVDAQTGVTFGITTGENNCITIDVPAGYQGTITVAYVSPWYWHLAEGITLLSWGFVLVLAVKARKKKRLAEAL